MTEAEMMGLAYGVLAVFAVGTLVAIIVAVINTKRGK